MLRPIMQCRQAQLKEALDALYVTDTPLVSLSQGSFGSSNVGDDSGIFYFIPYLAKAFDLSSENAAAIFFGLLMSIGMIVSIGCFLSFFKSWPARILCILALIRLGMKFWDVYIAMYFAVAALIPFYLVFNKKIQKVDWKFIVLLALSGIVIGYSNFIRGHAGTGVLFFIIFWILLKHEFPAKEKAISLALLLMFTSLPYFHVHYLESQRDAFLRKINPSHISVSVIHPLWHNAYIGFGYLPNDYDIRWDDGCADEKAKSIDPDVKVYSEEYLQILKNEIIAILKNHPFFVLKTFFYKTLAIGLIFLKYMNLGVLLLFYVKPPLREMVPIAIANLFFALPGFLAIPRPEYLAGMITLSSIFGLYLCALSVEKFLKSSNLRLRFSRS